jgi:hypothetical protein
VEVLQGYVAEFVRIQGFVAAVPFSEFSRIQLRANFADLCAVARRQQVRAPVFVGKGVSPEDFSSCLLAEAANLCGPVSAGLPARQKLPGDEAAKSALFSDVLPFLAVPAGSHLWQPSPAPHARGSRRGVKKRRFFRNILPISPGEPLRCIFRA